MPDTVLFVLATNLTNCAASVRRLCCAGFDSQARHLVRLFSELADTMIAIADDYEHFRNYVAAPQQDLEHHWHWRNHLNPTITRKRVFAAMEKMPGYDETLKEWTGRFDENYRWLSAFSHARWIGQAVSAYSRQPSGLMRPSLFGVHSTDSSVTLAKLGTHMFLTVSMLRSLLFNRHGWDKFPAGSRQAEWILVERQ